MLADSRRMMPARSRHTNVARLATLSLLLGAGIALAAEPTEWLERMNKALTTRNYVGVLTSVNCSASAAKFIAEAVNRSGILADYPGVDGVVAFVHGTGCGMAARGEGWNVLQRTQ